MPEVLDDKFECTLDQDVIYSHTFFRVWTSHASLSLRHELILILVLKEINKVWFSTF